MASQRTPCWAIAHREASPGRSKGASVIRCGRHENKLGQSALPLDMRHECLRFLPPCLPAISFVILHSASLSRLSFSTAQIIIRNSMRHYLDGGAPIEETCISVRCPSASVRFQLRLPLGPSRRMVRQCSEMSSCRSVWVLPNSKRMFNSQSRVRHRSTRELIFCLFECPAFRGKSGREPFVGHFVRLSSRLEFCQVGFMPERTLLCRHVNRSRWLWQGRWASGALGGTTCA